MSNKNLAKDWAEKCGKSNGTMVIVPEAMNSDTEEFSKKTDEYLALAKSFDKASAEFDVFAKNFWHKMRQALEAEGIEEIWGKNIGWNEQAKKEGFKVINIMAGGQGPMQMRG
jgi:hypothetical protein